MLDIVLAISGEDSASGRDPLEMPRHPAAEHGGPWRSTSRWPRLAGRPVGPPDEATAGDDGTADPGRDRHVEEIVAPDGRTEPALRQRRDLGVAIEERRELQRLRDERGERDVTERRAQVRRIQDRAGPRVDGPRGGDADPGERRGPRVRVVVGADPLEGGDTGCDDRGAAVLYRCPRPTGVADLAAPVDRRRPDLRAAEVEGENGSREGWCFRRPPAQPLTEPASRPRTKYRCRQRNTSTGSSIVTNAPAVSSCQSWPARSSTRARG